MLYHMFSMDLIKMLLQLSGVYTYTVTICLSWWDAPKFPQVLKIEAML